MSEQASSRRQSSNDLIGFAGPVLDLILRLKAGIVKPSNDLRPKIASLLKEFEDRALRYRHRESIIQVTKFALASFVDETVLTNDFNLKEEWERVPIQLEYFGEHLAGNKFYEKLDKLIPDITNTADAVEVYYVCLLLGFKGRYAVYEQEKLQNIMQRTADALVKVGKISKVELSPHWLVQDQPIPPEKRGMPNWAKIAAFGGLCLAILIYLIMFLMSSAFLDDAIKKLQL